MIRNAPTFSLALTVLSTALLNAPRATAQQVETEIDQVASRMQVGRTEMLHLIAPDHFGEADDRLRRARSLYEQGGNLSEIRSELEEAREELARAEGFAEIGEVILRDALSAREAALAANAPEFSTELWEEGEDRIREAGRDIEDGDQNDARERAEEAVQRYQRAELLAIRRDVLGYTRRVRDEARESDAHEKASVTFSRADSLLNEAEGILQEDRYERSEATRLAQAASVTFQYAERIAALFDDVEADDAAEFEALILRYDRELRRIAEALNFTPSFLEGPEPVASESITAIEGLYEQRNSLQSDVRDREERIAALQAQVDSAELRLGRLADSLGARAEMEAARRRATNARLRARQEREEKVERTRNLFDPGEAEVLLRGSELLIRLHGLAFPVGSAEIRPENFPLLTKVQETLRQFPARRSLTIAGHTDAQGNDDYNQALSERRAEAVRQYLVANMRLSEASVSAVGFGESQPVASNETQEGRAQNRRIDVILGLPPLEEN